MSQNKTDKEYLKLKGIAPIEWNRLVHQVSLKCRTEVAHIIWWDHFAHRPAADRWPHLDEFLTRPVWKNPTDQQLIAGLMKCGYGVNRATQRVTGKVIKKLA